MIGQTKIIETINSLSYKELPQSILLLGNRGSGKHTLCSYIANHYNTILVDISEDISKDLIDDIYIGGSSVIYLIDIVLASKSKKIINLQNAILKLVEEPPVDCKIIILSETKSQILDTIVNRCQVWPLERYSLQELRTFSSDLTDDELMMLSTPGRVKSTSHELLTGIDNLCDNIIMNIHKAGFSNTLSIVDKINFTDENDKYDLDLFNLCLRNKLATTTYFASFMLIKELMENCKLLNVNKKYLFEEFLLNLKGVFDEYKRV